LVFYDVGSEETVSGDSWSIITRENILKNEYPVRTVLEAMDTGLLLLIEEALMLIHEM
jgi:hypothetical protein